MTKLYVISEVAWDYDDENYHRSEGVGAPIKGYRNREAAQKECDRLNGEWLRTTAQDMFGYGYDEEGVPIGYELVEMEVATEEEENPEPGEEPVKMKKGGKHGR